MQSDTPLNLLFHSHNKWSTRRVSLMNASAQFGGSEFVLDFKPLGMIPSTILSREISTDKLRISLPTVTTTATPPATPPTTPPTTPPSDLEKEALETIGGNDRLFNIYNQVPKAEYDY